MGIMDMFRSAATPAGSQPPAPQGQTAQPGNLPATIPPMIAQGSADGQIPGATAQPQAEVSPFAEFNKLWDTPTLPDGQVPDAPIKFNIDAAKVTQSAKAIDFTKSVTPALLEKINAGGEGAMAAMLQAMNEMGQTVFAQAMMANTRVLENGLESSHQRVQKTLPDTIRKQTIGNALREDNPLFNNPATAPMLSMLENQLTTQFPTASAAEIKDHAKRYLSTFAGEISKQATPTTSQAQASKHGREIDWSLVET